MLMLRSLLSFRWSSRFAVVTPIRAISGTATTIRPFARRDRSSHHRRSPRAWSGTRGAELAPRDLTRYPLSRDHRDLPESLSLDPPGTPARADFMRDNEATHIGLISPFAAQSSKLAPGCTVKDITTACWLH